MRDVVSNAGVSGSGVRVSVVEVGGCSGRRLLGSS